MGEHYFTEEPTSRSLERLIHVNYGGSEFRFYTDSGVFSKDGLDNGTRALIGAISEESGNFLDLGCGWGPVGIIVAARSSGMNVLMADVNSRAVELTKKNIAENGLNNAVVRQSDVFENIGEKFDVIATNPPIRAGKAVIYRMFDEAGAHLSPGGSLYIVIRKQQGAKSAIKHLEGIYSRVEVVERSGGFWVIKSAM